MAEKVPSWPKVTIRLYDAHNGEVKIAGRSHPINAADPRAAALELVIERAAQLGRPVKATAVEEGGESWPLIIHPDGDVEVLQVTKKKKKSMWPVYAAAGLALVLIGGTLTYLLAIRDPGPKTPKVTTSPTLPPLPLPRIVPEIFDARPVPPTWSNKGDWTVDLAEGSRPAVSPDGKLVAVITPEKRIAMLDPAGKVLWQDKVTDAIKQPYFTTIDGNPVVAAVAEGVLVYWPRVGAGLAVEIDLPSSAKVEFTGSAPLVLGTEGEVMTVSGDQLKPIDRSKLARRAEPLLAEGRQAVFSAYFGPWWLAEPDKDPVQVNPAKPGGAATTLDHIVAASPGRVLALWRTKDPRQVVPVVHSVTTGAVLAACPAAEASGADSAQWAPDPGGKIAAWGECVISFATRTPHHVNGLEPASATGGWIYGTLDSDGAALRLGQAPVRIASGFARPWGVAGGRAIVVHKSVLYALAPGGG